MGQYSVIFLSAFMAFDDFDISLVQV